uniref:Protein max n=1 Tax=Culex pipiens TaxID=7175 RepID=A0A8D8C013_CULPI
MRLYEDQAGNSYDNMSDDDRDIDIDSDDGEDSDNTKSQPRNSSGGQFYSQAEKRAHHNALERKRRDHIKDSFTSLRDSVPSLQGEKVSKRSEKVNGASGRVMWSIYLSFTSGKPGANPQESRRVHSVYAPQEQLPPAGH